MQCEELIVILNRATLIQILIYLINCAPTNYHTMHVIIYLFLLSVQHFMQLHSMRKRGTKKADFKWVLLLFIKQLVKMSTPSSPWYGDDGKITSLSLTGQKTRSHSCRDQGNPVQCPHPYSSSLCACCFLP